MPTISQEIYMLSVSHGHYTNRYGGFLANQANEHLSGVYSESRALLRDNLEMLRESFESDTTPTRSRFRSDVDDVLDELYEIRNPTFDESFEQLDQELREFSVYETDYTQERIMNQAAENILDDLPIEIVFAAANAGAVFGAAMNSIFSLGGRMNGTMNNLISGIPSSERRRFRDTIQAGFFNNSNNQTILRSVFNRNSAAAQESVTRRSVETMARTSVASISQQAKRLTGEANESLIRGWRNVAVFDARTSQICQSIGVLLGSDVFPEYTDIPPVPRHPRCRSQIVMVTVPWNEALRTDLVSLRTEQGRQRTFVAPTRSTPQRLREQLASEGLSEEQISQYIQRMSGETSELSLSGFLNEQRERGNSEFLEAFFGAKERARLYIDGELPLDRLYDFENRKAIPLVELE